MKFSVVLIPDPEDGGYTAECPAIPGCFSEGDTVESAIANIKEAIEGCVESLIANNKPIPDDGSVIVANVDVDVAIPAKS